MHFVTGATELRRLMQWLEESLLVKTRLGFNQQLVDLLQNRILAERERILDGFFDHIIRIAASTIDVSDRVAGGTRNTRLRRRVVHIVVVRIIKRAGKKRDHVVATRTPARSLHRPVPFEHFLASFTDRI